MDENKDFLTEDTTVTTPQQDTLEVVSTPTENDDATVILNLEGLINSTLAKIDRLTQESRKHNEMVESVLEGDPTYRDHAERAKEAIKVRNTTKQEIMKRPDVRPIAEKVKELRMEIKEAKESLAEYLPEYHRISGQKHIEDENGEVREITYTAKLVKRSAPAK